MLTEIISGTMCLDWISFTYYICISHHLLFLTSIFICAYHLFSLFLFSSATKSISTLNIFHEQNSATVFLYSIKEAEYKIQTKSANKMKNSVFYSIKSETAARD